MRAMVAGLVNDNQWRYAVLTGSAAHQVLYLDGVAASTTDTPGSIATGTEAFSYVGAGRTGSGNSGLTANVDDYFAGRIAEVAYYRHRPERDRPCQLSTPPAPWPSVRSCAGWCCTRRPAIWCPPTTPTPVSS